MYAYHADESENRCAVNEASVVNKNIMFSTSNSFHSILQGLLQFQPHNLAEDCHRIVVVTLSYAPEVPLDLSAFLPLQEQRYLCGKAFEELAQHTTDMNVLVCAQEEEAEYYARIHLLLMCSFALAPKDQLLAQDNRWKSAVAMTSVAGLLCSSEYRKDHYTVTELGDGLEKRHMHHIASMQMDTAGGMQPNGKLFLLLYAHNHQQASHGDQGIAEDLWKDTGC